MKNNKDLFIHPELKDGEVFLCNESDDNPYFYKIPLPSKRKGCIAYTIYGEILFNYSPIFISKEDVKLHGGMKSLFYRVMDKLHPVRMWDWEWYDEKKEI